MSAETQLNPLWPSPRLLRLGPPAVAWSGIGWNLFGVVQFARSLTQTREDLLAMGVTLEQAIVATSVPAWMNLAFAIGVSGGLLGSVLLLAQRRRAVPIFAASLVGYLVLFVGDVTEGVFAAFGPPQVAILTTVVAIAVGLLAWSYRLRERGALR